MPERLKPGSLVVGSCIKGLSHDTRSRREERVASSITSWWLAAVHDVWSWCAWIIRSLPSTVFDASHNLKLSLSREEPIPGLPHQSSLLILVGGKKWSLVFQEDRRTVHQNLVLCLVEDSTVSHMVLVVVSVERSMEI